MNKFTYLSSVILMLFFVSCEELERLTVFEIDYDSEFTVASTTIIDVPISIETPPVPTNSESEFESNNTSSSLIESIQLKRLSLIIESPESGDFNFLQEVRLFIDAEGLEETEIAFAEDLENENLKVIELETTRAELKEFLKKDSFTLRASTTTDETINEDHKIKVDCVFRVDANILGL
ncbi:hypothetical protein [uncultured Aquimarina sp.]|uniref:hypothetical protein n=1 Tax=uncultured Aquimarina sp. TaxID=575652 RepID=UPI0026072C6F|nr:hypothetical protein [uncultured Aquimarina sp.]